MRLHQKTLGWLASVVAAAVAFASMPVFADEWTDAHGITWEYDVLDGGSASVFWAYKDGGEDEITGDLEIPASVGTDNLSVVGIGDWAFEDCSIRSVKIPASVVIIGSWAFANCSSLETVVFEGDESAIYIAEMAFSGTPYNESKPFALTIKDGVLQGFVGKCPAEVEIPAGVRSIDESAFDADYSPSVSNLTAVVIPDSVTNIGVYAFWDCESLASVSLGKGVATIEVSAFYGCRSLSALSFGSALETVKANAFSGCQGFAGQTLTFPESIRSLPVEAFSGIDGTVKVKIPTKCRRLISGGELSVTREVRDEQSGEWRYVTVNTSVIAVYYGEARNNFTATFLRNEGNWDDVVSKVELYDGCFAGDLPKTERYGFFFDGWNTRADGTGEKIERLSVVSAATSRFYAIWKESPFEVQGQWALEDDGTLRCDVSWEGAYLAVPVFGKGVFTFEYCLEDVQGYLYVEDWNSGECLFEKQVYYKTKWDQAKIVSNVPDARHLAIFLEVWGMRGNGGCLRIRNIEWTETPVVFSFDGNGGEGEMPSAELRWSEEMGWYEEAVVTNLFAREGYYCDRLTYRAPGQFEGEPDYEWPAESYDEAGRAIFRIPAEIFVDWEAEEPEFLDGTFKVHWTPFTHMVTFKANSSVVIAQWQQDFGTPLLPPDSERPGYRVSAWTPALPEAMPNSNVTFVATWAKNEFSVSFDANGGEGEMAALPFAWNDETESYGASVVVTNTLVREGYAFVGWRYAYRRVSPEGDVEEWEDVLWCDDAQSCDIGPDLNNYKDVVLKAEWVKNVEFTLDANDGSGQSVAVTMQYPFDYEDIPVVTNNVFAREGYTLVGWTFRPFWVEEWEDDYYWDPQDADDEHLYFQFDPWMFGGTDDEYGWPLDGTLKAQWVPNGHTISFKDDITQPPFASWDLEYGEPIIPPDSTDPAFRIVGWTPEIPQTMPDSNVTFVATWANNEFAVSFDANGGEGEMAAVPFAWDASTGSYGDTALVTNAFVREGYTLVGWSYTYRTVDTDGYVDEWGGYLPCDFAYDDDGYPVLGEDGRRVVMFSVPPDLNNYKDVVLTADWVKDAVLTLDANDGSGEIVSVVVPYPFDYEDVPIVTNNVFAREGYTLVGWTYRPFGADEEEDDYRWDPQDMDDEHLYFQFDPWMFGNDDEYGWPLDGTVKARWSRNVVVTLDANDGSGEKRNVELGWSDELGWYQRRTLKSPFAVEGHSVAYWTDLQGGEWWPEFYDEEDGRACFVLSADMFGYDYDWYGTPTLMDGELRAEWQANVHSIAFKGDATQEAFASWELEYGAPICPPDSPDQGWKIVGWTPELPQTMPDSNVVFVADWQLNEFTVSFDANGGEGEMADVPFAWDEATSSYGDAVLVTNAFVREGYTLAGWSYTYMWVDTSGWIDEFDYFIPCDEIFDGEGNRIQTFLAYPEISNYKDVVLRAEWIPNMHTVTFKANGKDELASWQQEFGTPIYPPDSDREGWKVVGWTPEILQTMPDSNVTFVATWANNEFSVSFDANGGEGDMAAVQFAWSDGTGYGDAAFVTNTFVREGYTLAGWWYTCRNVYADGSIDEWGGYLMCEFVYDDDGYPILGEDGRRVVVFSVPPELNNYKDVVLTADWVKDAVCTLDANDGSGETVSVAVPYPFDYEDVPVVTNNVFVREGYTLVGWTYRPFGADEEEDEEEDDYRWDPQDMDDEHLYFQFDPWMFGNDDESGWPLDGTVKAQWSKNVVVTLDANDGSGETLDVELGWSEELGWYQRRILTSPFAVEGHSVAYWTDQQGGEWWPEYYDEEDGRACFALSADMFGYDEDWYGNRLLKSGVLSAQWQANVHIASFKGNESDSPFAEWELAYGAPICPPDSDREGWKIVGWTPEIPQTMPDSNVTFVATWANNEFAVSFDANGGEGDMAAVPFAWSDGTGYGDAAFVTNTFVREGYTLAGWSYTYRTVDAGGYVDEWGGYLPCDFAYDDYGNPILGEDGRKIAVFSVPPDLNNYKDVVLKADWVMDAVFTLDANDGSERTSELAMQYPFDYVPVLTNNVFTNEGYTLVGWTYRPFGADEWEEDYRWDPQDADDEHLYFQFDPWMFGSDDDGRPLDGTLKAQWSRNEHTVTFKANAKDVFASWQQEYGTPICPPDSDREGWKIVGWTPEIPQTMPDSNVTFVATWANNEFAVSFDANGGEGDMAAVPFAWSDGTGYGDAAFVTNTFVREGYTLAGWWYTYRTVDTGGYVDEWDGYLPCDFVYDDDGYPVLGEDGRGVVVFSVPPELNNYKDVVLKADWVKDVVFTLDANDGSGRTLELAMQYPFDYAPVVTNDVFTNEGYTLVGWTYRPFGADEWEEDYRWDPQDADDEHLYFQFDPWMFGNDDESEWPLDGTLKARWSRNVVVTLDANDGSGDTVEVELGWDYESGWCQYKAIDFPFSFEGHTFAFWTDKHGNELPLDESSKTYVNADMFGLDYYGWPEDGVLKANWTVNSYTVAFDFSGGTDSNSNGRVEYVLDYGAGIVPPSPQFAGHTLFSWIPAIDSTVPASNVVYVAKWRQNNYGVAFDANGGEGEMAGMTVPYDEEHGLASNAFVKVGHTFAGWATEKDGEVVYADGAPIRFGADDADATLYAVWTVNSYTVVFDLSGGTDSNGNERVEFELDYGTALELYTPSANGLAREYYTFTSWMPAVDATVPAQDVVYAAQWVRNTWLVSLDPAYGTCEKDLLKVPCGNAVGTLPAAVRDNHTFAGWFLAGGAEVSSGTVPEDDVTYYAHWTFNGTIDVRAAATEGSDVLGKVTGAKDAVKPGAKVALKATANKGAAFVGWFTNDVLVATSTSYSYVAEGVDDVAFEARFATMGDDGLDVSGVDMNLPLKEAVSLAFEDCFTIKTVSALTSLAVSGLPTGLKYDAKSQTVTGEPSKAGIYYVVCTAKNGNGYQHSYTAVWNVGETASTDNDAGDIGKVALDQLTNLETGLAYEFAGFKNATAVSGLPTGLKFDKNTGVISGVPTKAGKAVLTFTGANKNKSQLTVIVRDGGMFALTLVADGNGTVSGGGVYAAGKKVTLKATAAKDNVFAGWYEGDDPLTGSADFRTASFPYVTVDGYVTLKAKFAKVPDDSKSLALVDMTNVTASASGDVALDFASHVKSLSLPALAVSGLPTGVKYDAKTLKVAGKTTKPGVYAVTVKATNASVKKATDATTAKFELTVPNFQCEALPNLLPATDAYGVVRAGVEFDPSRIDCSAADGWTVKVAGLPTGLKWDAKTGKVVGIPTAKAGKYTVTFTASKKGASNQTATITLDVEPLDEWANGTFDAISGDDYKDSTGFLQSLTIAANGKVSGKTVDAQGTWTLSAASFDKESVILDGVVEYQATVIAKNGKLLSTNILKVVEAEIGGSARGFVRLYDGETLVAQGVQNLWKVEPWKTAAKPFAKAKPYEVKLTDPKGTLTLKFAASGAVTTAGKFVIGQDAKGKDIVHSASCSSALVPVGGDVYSVTVYFPPKTDAKGNVFEGYAAALTLKWDGKNFTNN